MRVTKPTISIITAVKNAETTIKDCLQSVTSQNSPVEHIIIDGGSEDSTLDVIHTYAPETAKIISEPDEGIYQAINKGLALATGDVIGILNADDFYAHGNVISKVSKVFENSRVDACYGDLVYVDRRNPTKVVRYWKSCSFSKHLFYKGWMPPHPTLFVRQKVYKEYGSFNTKLGTASDYELILRFFLKYEVNTFYIPEILIVMRTGGVSGASFINRIRANTMDREAWRVNGLTPKPWTRFCKPMFKIGQFFPRKEIKNSSFYKWWSSSQS